jgi:hypothetical protein
VAEYIYWCAFYQTPIAPPNPLCAEILKPSMLLLMLMLRLRGLRSLNLQGPRTMRKMTSCSD